MAFTEKTMINTDIPEKDVFTLHFLQSLSNLTRQNPLNSPENTNDRVKKIKMAAYISMAKAAGGTKRLWSRALLRKAAKENYQIFGFPRKKVTWKMRRQCPSKLLRTDPVKKSNRRVVVGAKRLRSLVPGGGGMETSKLMEETAHYIKCLSIQVKVMQCLVDGLSPK